VHPVLGLIIGARYNLSLSNLYKNTFTGNSGGGMPGVSIDPRNNVIQVYAGWRF
jgi:hypothetical protein